MIRFSLICESGHEFEGWFKNGDDFETQRKRGFLECPACASSKVAKALMAPNISTSKRAENMSVAAADTAPREVLSKLQELARQVRKDGENVGSRFAEEARKIHYGEADPRGIYGKANRDEVIGLVEEGIGVLPLPDLPEDMN